LTTFKKVGNSGNFFFCRIDNTGTVQNLNVAFSSVFMTRKPFELNIRNFVVHEQVINTQQNESYL